MKTLLVAGSLVVILGWSGLFVRLSATDYQWTGAVSSEWSQPGNWTPAGVPGIGDTARIAGGSVATGGDVVVDRLVLTGGVVTCGGQLKVSVAMSWTGGELRGAGQLFIPVGAELGMGGDQSLGLVGLNVETEGTTRWTGSGSLSVSDGHAVWRNTGTWEIGNDGAITSGGSGGTLRVINEGTLRKTGASGTSGWYSARLENRGWLDLKTGSLLVGGAFRNVSNCVVRMGSLQPDGGGSNEGTVDLWEGALLELTGATFTNRSGATIPGAGTTRVTGRLRVEGEGAIEGLDLAGGTVDCVGQLTVTRRLVAARGTINGPGKLVIPTGAELVFSGDEARAMVGLNVETPGTTRWTGSGGLSLSDGHTVWRNTGTWEIQGNGQISNGGSGGTLRVLNEGTVRKSSATGTSGWYSARVENQGLLDLETGSLLVGGLFLNRSNCVVRAGSLRPDGGGGNDGAVDLRAGTSLELAGLVFTNRAGATILGAGTTRVSGQFRVEGEGTVEGLELAGGTVDCVGQLTVTRRLVAARGTINGPGKLVIPTGAELVFSGNEARAMVGLNVETPGTTRWTGSGGLSLSDGHTVWRNTGTWEVQGDGQISNGGSGGTLRVLNKGTLRKSSATGTSGWYSARVENQGLLDLETGSLLVGGLFLNRSNCVVRVGSLRPDGGGGNDGTMDLRAGTSLELAGVVFTNRAGATILGAGTTRVTAQLRVEGDGTMEGLELSGGTVDCVGQLTVSRQFHAVRGTIYGPGKLVIPTGAELVFSGNEARAMVGLNVETPGATRWTGSGGLSLSDGHTVWRNTGTWEVQGDGQISNGGSGGTLRVLNEGTVRKSSATGTSGWYSARVENQGLLDLETGSLLVGGLFLNRSNCVVRAGSLRPDGGGGNDGAVDLRAGTSLELAGLVFTNRAGATILGAGTTRVSGQFRVEGEGTVEGLELANGTVDCVGRLTVSRRFQAGGGTINGPGKLVIPAGAEFGLGGDQPRGIAGLTVETAGTTSWSGSGGISLSDRHSVWRNTGVWEVTGAGQVSNGGSGGTLRLRNDGTLRKSVSVGNTGFYSTRVENLGWLEVRTGTLEFGGGPLVQTAGTTWLAGGTLKAVEGFDIQAGRLGGRGTVAAPVTCGGLIEPGDPIGVLQVVGDLQLSAAATLTVELAGSDPAGGYDRLVVTGRATVGGRLNARLSGGFLPGFNSRFGILAGGARTGTFSTFVADPLPPGNFLTPEYVAGGVDLVTLDATPAFAVGPAPLAGGEFRFSMSGIAGQCYVVEATTNLVGVIQWSPVATNLLAGSGVWEFVDPETSRYAHRFFRAVHAP